MFASATSPKPTNDFYEFENFNDFQTFSEIKMDSTDLMIASAGIAVVGSVGLYYYNEKVLTNIVKFISLWPCFIFMFYYILCKLLCSKIKNK